MYSKSSKVFKKSSQGSFKFVVFLFFLIWLPKLFAEDGLSNQLMAPAGSTQTDADKDPDKEDSLQVYFGIEAREQTDRRRDRPMNLRETTIKEARFGMKKQLNASIEGHLEVSIEDFQGESEFYLRDAWVKWEALSGFDLKVGQFFQPIGWFGPEDFWFVHLPSYYQQLFKGDKPIDIGVQLNWRPFNTEWFELEGACFRGQIFRRGDGRFNRPEEEPCLATVRSKSSYHHLFVIRQRQHLAFFDPVEATGVGLELETPKWGRLQAHAGMTGEHWWIQELQGQGIDLFTRGWFLFPHFSIWRMHAGIRLGETHRNFETAQLGPMGLKIREQAIRVEVSIHKYFSVVIEDHIEVSDRLLTRDDFTVRVLFRTADW